MSPAASGSLIEANLRLALTAQAPVLSVDTGIEALLGFTRQDFLSARVSLEKQFHPDDLDLAEVLFSPENSPSAGVVNIRLRQANGRIRCIKAQFRKAPGPDGVILELLLQDAKSLKRTMSDASLMVNFTAMMESTDDYIYFKDRNHVFTGASQTLVALCSPAEHWTDLLGQTDYDVFPEQLADIYYRLEKQVFAGLPVAHEVQETLAKDGQKGWVDNRKYPIRDAQGEIIGLYGIARDITALRRSEAELRDEKERIKTIFDTVGDPIYVKDKEHRVIAANRAFHTFFGLKESDVLGQTFAGQLPPDEVERLWAVDRQVLETGRMALGEESLTVRGSPRALIIRKTRFIEHSGEKFLLCSIHDITARKQAEAEAEAERIGRKMQEVQKLESLGMLAGGIAHDFNNLLTGILGNASLASLSLPPVSPVQENLEAIKVGSRRAAELCSQMLAYSGKGRFVVQKLSLNTLVEETTHLLQISISKKAVLRFNLHPKLPAIEADATQIRQVIMNLVINASEAIGDKSGVISLNTGLTRVDRAYLGGTVSAPDLPAGTYVHLEVSDSGCGMSTETQARIFDPFFTTKFTGRGLGLAAVLGIVRGHKGSIKIYSEPGRGSTFKLLFPCAENPAPESEAASPAQPAWRGHGCALVVDDEESVRSIAAAMLQQLGYEIMLASDGREALQLFKSGPDRFSLVLMDLTMPHLDGEQTFSELRKLDPKVSVVLMSGFNEQEAILRFTGKGLAGFLQKPFEFETLCQALSETQNRKARGS